MSSGGTPATSYLERRLLVLAAVSAVAAFAVFSRPAIPQDPGYHAFADVRTLLGVPNLHNVLSNLPFLIVGLLGLAEVARRVRVNKGSVSERGAWTALFLGVALTAFGSAYYHWAPDNHTLLWDRLPMTLGFMGFFAGVIGERISQKAYVFLLWPMIGIGVASVLYWYATENHGIGDLRAYIMVQFFPLLTIPLIMALYKPRFSHSKLILGALAGYAAAKGVEVYDSAIYGATGGLVGGHALKHLLAACACWLLYHMFKTRQPLAT